MSKKTVAKLTSYAVAVLIGGAMAFLVAHNYGFGEAENWMIRFRVLCDAFTIPGCVLLCCGVLCWIAQQGTFDMLGYAGRALMRVFYRVERDKRYYDYVEERREKRAAREKGYFMFLIVTGAAFLLLAVIFLLLFYRLYNNQ